MVNRVRYIFSKISEQYKKIKAWIRKLNIKIYEASTLLVILLVSILVIIFTDSLNHSTIHNIGIGVFTSTIVAILIFITTIVRERKEREKYLVISYINEVTRYLRLMKYELQDLLIQKKTNEAEATNRGEQYNEFSYSLNYSNILRLLADPPIFETSEYAEAELLEITERIYEKLNLIECDIEVSNYARIVEFQSDIFKLRRDIAQQRTKLENK